MQHVALLRRVVSGRWGDRDHVGRLFAFCVDYFRRNGPGASVLFEGAGVDALGAKKVAVLAELKGFAWNFLNQSFCPTIVTAREDACRAAAQLAIAMTEIAPLREEVAGMRAAMEGRCGRIEQEMVTSEEHKANLEQVREEIRKLADVQAKLTESLEKKGVNCPTSAGPLERIIAYLTKQCGGDLHERDVFRVTSSSGNPKILVAGTDSCLLFAEQPNQWVGHEFRRVAIRPTHYSIKSCTGPKLRSWVVEASDDGASWIEIDRKDGDSSLDSNNVVQVFLMTAQRQCRFVRLRQTDRNHQGTTAVQISLPWQRRFE
jgi:hypothetical protein